MTYPFILTILAGFSTVIGSIPIFFKIKNKNNFIASACSFAAGVMICISIFDLIPESFLSFANYHYSITLFLTFIFIILGIILSYMIDTTIDKFVNKSALYKTGILSMLAIILHNIPEGIITYIVTSQNTIVGLKICFAIALHNIPEGISIAIPIYYATKSKWQAIGYTLLSALSEPFGAILTSCFLQKYLSNLSLGILFGIIGGIMLEISFNKLMPTAYSFNKEKSHFFIIIGFIFMLISLIINKLFN